MKDSVQQNENYEGSAMNRLIGARLRARLRDEPAAHPDDDVINAFVEGTLDDAELHSLTTHLVGCSSCLHLTAQLIRLEPEEEEPVSLKPSQDEPGPLQRFFDRLSDELTPSFEDSVFAYQDPTKADSEDKSKTEKEPEKDESDPT